MLTGSGLPLHPRYGPRSAPPTRMLQTYVTYGERLSRNGIDRPHCRAEAYEWYSSVPNNDSLNSEETESMPSWSEILCFSHNITSLQKKRFEGPLHHNLTLSSSSETTCSCSTNAPALLCLQHCCWWCSTMLRTSCKRRPIRRRVPSTARISPRIASSASNSSMVPTILSPKRSSRPSSIPPSPLT
jgi:hypothetical protein